MSEATLLYLLRHADELHYVFGVSKLTIVIAKGD